MNKRRFEAMMDRKIDDFVVLFNLSRDNIEKQSTNRQALDFIHNCCTTYGYEKREQEYKGRYLGEIKGE